MSGSQPRPAARVVTWHAARRTAGNPCRLTARVARAAAFRQGVARRFREGGPPPDPQPEVVEGDARSTEFVREGAGRGHEQQRPLAAQWDGERQPGLVAYRAGQCAPTSTRSMARANSPAWNLHRCPFDKGTYSSRRIARSAFVREADLWMLRWGTSEHDQCNTGRGPPSNAWQCARAADMNWRAGNGTGRRWSRRAAVASVHVLIVPPVSSPPRRKTGVLTLASTVTRLSWFSGSCAVSPSHDRAATLSHWLWRSFS